MEYIKKVIEQTFEGKMAVFSLIKVRENGKTTLQKTLVYDNIPCLLTSMVSYRSVPRDIEDNKNFIKSRKVGKVFLSNNIDVEMGSYIEILQNGKLYTYDYSGEILCYKTHQEIILETKRVI